MVAAHLLAADMTAPLHLAGPDDLAALLPLVAEYHAFEGIQSDAQTRQAALAPLLAGAPHGAVWRIGDAAAPWGYIAISYGWSIELGGLDGFVDEFFLRPEARGQGLGGRVLATLLPLLRAQGMRALHLEVAADNGAAARL